jgi:periplasmic divalent cation tolerance protein
VNCYLVISTVPDIETARNIAEKAVGSGTAACVNIVPQIESVYRWKGDICRDTELMLFMKTTAERKADLKKVLLECHPYEVPELIEIPIEGGHQPYLEWIKISVAEN